MTNKHNRCSTLLTTRKMQTETTIKFHVTHTRVATTDGRKEGRREGKNREGEGKGKSKERKRKEKKITSVGEDVEKLTLLVQPLWKTVWHFLKIKNKITTWASNSEATVYPCSQQHYSQ